MVKGVYCNCIRGKLVKEGGAERIQRRIDDGCDRVRAVHRIL